MNRKEENRLTMFLSVDKVLQDNSTLWNTVPAMATAVGNFTANLSLLRKTLDKQQAPIKGVARDKRNALLAMANKALEVKGAIVAFADVSHNETLKERVNFSFSKLTHSSDTLCAEFAQIIKDEAQAIVSQLTPYGVGNNALTQFQQLIDAYSALVPATRVAITARKLATKNIKSIIGGINGLLTNRIDKLMFKFKASAPDFFTQYFDARIIIDLKQTAPSANNPPAAPSA